MANKTDHQSVPIETIQHSEVVVHKSSLFKLDPGLGIWSLVLFVVLLIVLKKLAWTPILASVKKRDKSIRDSLDQMKSVQNESKKLAQEQEEILSVAKLSASKIISDAKESAEKVGEVIRAEAEHQKEKVLKNGLKELDVAQNLAKKELQKYVATLAINLAERLIHESLDSKKQSKIVDDFLREVELSS